MKVKFRGYCNGTITRVSNKTGKEYQITRFCEALTLDTIELFGDLGLAAHEDAREYEISGKITGFEFPEVYVNGKQVVKKNQPVATLPDTDFPTAEADKAVDGKKK